jgi:hypothetical protein
VPKPALERHLLLFTLFATFGGSHSVEFAVESEEPPTCGL